jgi:hypothetical protein
MNEPTDVWGLAEGRCAWCGICYATKNYLAHDSQGDYVKYNVCGVCYLEFAPFKQNEVAV